MESGTSSESFRTFRTSLQEIVGTECWSSIGGMGTGSAFVLDFGDKVRRKSPLTNRHLSEEQRSFQGSIWLHILGCTWRVDTATEVLGAWDVGETRVEDMVALMSGLVGGRVTAANVELPGLDLTLSFDNGMTLRLFCDQTDLEHEMDNYSICVGGTVYGVETRSKLVIEQVDQQQ